MVGRDPGFYGVPAGIIVNGQPSALGRFPAPGRGGQVRALALTRAATNPVSLGRGTQGFTGPLFRIKAGKHETAWAQPTPAPRARQAGQGFSPDSRSDEARKSR
jgi:hypothetical protein